jgi:uncharacterized protein YqgC (DUF456 family)
MLTVVLWLCVVVLMAIGLAGTVLPVLPGAVLIFAGAVLGGWIDAWSRVSWWTLGVLGVLAVLSIVCDFVAGAFGAKRLGASPMAVTGAAIGTFVGVFTGLWGLLFMPLVGAAIGEYVALRNLQRAGRVGVATGVGLLIGTAVKIALAFSMIGIFVAALLI